MKTKFRLLWNYLIMTLLLIITACAVIYIAGKPVYDYVISYISRMLVKIIG